MDLIRGSALIVLNCVLAYSQPPINYLAPKPISYDIVSPIPQSGILQTPYYDKIPEMQLSRTPTFVVKPSWHTRLSSYNPGMVDKGDVKNSQSPSNKPELIGTALKGIGLKYPPSAPDVKLGFIGNGGVLPVTKTQNTPANKAEPPNKVLKPTGSDFSTKPGEKSRFKVELYKNIQPPSFILVVMPAKLDYPSINSGVIYRQDKLPLNQLTHSSKPERPDIVLYPTDFGHSPTNPENDYRKYKEAALKSIYTPTYKPDVSEIGVLKPTYADYTPTNPGVYGKVDLLEKSIPYTPSYKTYVPTITASRPDYPCKKDQDLPLYAMQQTPSFEGLPVGVLKPSELDYPVKSSVGKDEDEAAMELPPVPTNMSLLQRTQLALMNTVAGLPGGNQQLLNSVRAR